VLFGPCSDDSLGLPAGQEEFCFSLLSGVAGLFSHDNAFFFWAKGVFFVFAPPYRAFLLFL